MKYPETQTIDPLNKPMDAIIRVPGSKSITNRALVLAALTAGTAAQELRGVLQSEDTEVMVEALRALGFRILTEWPETTLVVSARAGYGPIPTKEAELFCANSGTTLRFLTAMVSLGHGKYRLDGIPRMRERPIQDLLDALRTLGVDARSENSNGCPPVIVKSSGLHGGQVRIKGNVSSQFLSALLMAAPFASSEVKIKVDGPLVSWPYVAMTLHLLKQWGLKGSYHLDDDCIKPGAELIKEAGRFGHHSDQVCFHIPGNQTVDTGFHSYLVEPDASAASYFFGAAAIMGGEATIPGLTAKSLQGDIFFVDILEEMGCMVQRKSTGLTVIGRPLHGVDVDMNDISDTVMTLGAVACFAEGPTTIRNVAHIRHKETDRLAALAAELRRVGAGVEEFPDGLKIIPRPLHGATIETYNDHRMAMSLALVGLKVPGIIIKNPSCVAKTYPRFFDDLDQLRESPESDKIQ